MGDDDVFTVSRRQWEALELVVARADTGKATYLAKKVEGDAAVTYKTAAALMRRGFVNVTAGHSVRPTPGGRTALATHIRLHKETPHGPST